MKNTIAILAVFSLVLGLVVYSLVGRCQRLSSEVDRQSENVVTALSKVERYRAFGDSIQVASCRQLELTREEYKGLFEDKDKEIRQLRGIKHPTQVIEVEIIVSDTVVVENTPDGSDRLFTYEDKYISIYGRSKPDTTIIAYSNYCPINVIEHQKRKRFLGFLWYTKKVETVRVEVYSPNPKAVVDRVSSVRIKD